MGGTWIAWGTGKVPVGINTSDTDFNTVEKTGGTKNHTHTYAHTHGVPGVAHTHTTGNHTLTVSETPSHYHWVIGEGRNAHVTLGDSTWSWSNGVIPNSGNNAGTHVRTDDVGGNGAHNHGNTGSTTPSATTTNSQSTSTSGSSSNLQPYITCYMWKRTA